MRMLTLTIKAEGQPLATFTDPTFEVKRSVTNMARVTGVDVILTAQIQEKEGEAETLWRDVKYTPDGKAVKLWEQEGQT